MITYTIVITAGDRYAKLYKADKFVSKFVCTKSNIMNQYKFITSDGSVCHIIRK